MRRRPSSLKSTIILSYTRRIIITNTNTNIMKKIIITLSTSALFALTSCASTETIVWKMDKGIDYVGVEDVFHDILSNDYEGTYNQNARFSYSQENGEIYCTLENGTTVSLIKRGNDWLVIEQ